MPALSSLEDLNDLRARILAREDTDVPTVVISAGTCGQACGANDLIRLTKRKMLAEKLQDRMRLRITGCHGSCQFEPFVVVQPAGTFYPKVGRADVSRIVEAALAGTVVEDLLFVDPVSGRRVERQADIPFYARQTRHLLSRNEVVDPIHVHDYLQAGGYAAFASVLERGDPEWVVDAVKRSGLRGRGGAGFPTGVKWTAVRSKANGQGAYLICNADEGDPGAYMDRSLLEGTPHSIIEGMLIGAYAMGASRGYVYVRNEYPLAVKHTVIALLQARDLGLLGDDILGSGFSFDVEVVRGAGAFVCGEETALIRSIEGAMGEPRQRPPFPFERGLRGRPTCINNVETWANVPVILTMGSEAYASVGTEGSAGTKVFSLVGKVRNTGLVEVPMGITIGEIVHEIGNGPPEGRRVKAVQIGGPSGGCIPQRRFDLHIGYDSLSGAGAIMGSGGMIVMDDHTCMVDLAKYFLAFLKDESCGKCFTCRKGTQRMHEILDDITRGKGTLDQLELLEELADVVRDTTMCGLGRSAPNPVLSTLRYFRDEYVRHVVDRRCDAFVCKDLVGAPCASACPIGTEAWRYVAHIARGEFAEAYAAIRETNPFPSVCARVCDHKCEYRCRLGAGGQRPVAIRALKRFITDRMDPAAFSPAPRARVEGDGRSVAVVGAGPAGLTAAHMLTLLNHRVTVFEAEDRPGGMLVSGVPAYRLPRAVLEKEIAALGESLDVRCGQTLGKDFTLDGLFEQGYEAVFLALGAHRSRRLGVAGEEADGVYPSMRFLKSWNLGRENLARGRVGVVGGGNSALDAARVALRQPGVESVTILYRRTRDEMPAFSDEVDAALEEGIGLETLVSPARVHAEAGKVTGLELVRNSLGEVDASGRRRPVPQAGTEHVVPLDTLIVAIGEQVRSFAAEEEGGLQLRSSGSLIVDEKTLETGRTGVFAGGDAVTGPNTVVDAIAAGRRAATMIDRSLRGEDLRRPEPPRLPTVHVEPVRMSPEELAELRRAAPPLAPLEERRSTFAEVELALNAAQATREASRCLRCDLEFTAPKEGKAEPTRASDEAEARP